MLERSRKARLIALIAAGFLLMGTDCAWSQSPPAPESQPEQQATEETAEQESAADQAEPDDSAPWIARVLADAWDCFVSFARENEASVSLLSVILIAVFTGLLFVSTTGLWAIGVCTARRQLRAYLMPDKVSVRVGNNGVTIHVTMKNFGQTPAANISTWTAITITPEDAPEPRIERSDYTVGPGGKFEMEPARQIGEQAIGAITEGRETASFRAKIVYRDTFRIRRHTDMQARLVLRRGEWILRPTETNNGYS